MNLDDFKKYIQSRKKLDSEFKQVPNLDEQYNNYLAEKKRVNERTKSWYKEKIEIDDDFKQKRKEYNKRSYQKLKSKQEPRQELKQEPNQELLNRGIIKMNINIPEPTITEKELKNEHPTKKIMSMLDLYGSI
jgi:hypothetical protein